MGPEVVAFFPLVIDGAPLTLMLGLAFTAPAMTLGVLGATARLSGSRAIRAFGTIHAAVIRAIPDLVPTLPISFGGQIPANAVVERTGLIERFEIPKLAAGASCCPRSSPTGACDGSSGATASGSA